MGFEILDSKTAGSGYDLIFKVSVDGEIRYLYYAEMPDRCYVLGWSMYEISAASYEASTKDPYIRYVGSFSGEDYHRANEYVYQALKEGLYVQSKWDKWYGDIYLVKELNIKKSLLEYETIKGNYFEAKLSDGSTHYLYREMHFINLLVNKSVTNTRFYEISAETFETNTKDNISKEFPPYLRYLGAIPGPSKHSSDWGDIEKKAIYRALTEDVSIYPYIYNDEIVLKAGQCPLHEPFEIPGSVCDHDSNKQYHYVVWKVLLDGKDVHYLVLIRARKQGAKSVKVYEIGENQMQNKYLCHYRCGDGDLQRVWDLDDRPDRHENIFRQSNVYFYKIASEPEYGGIPLNETLDAPLEYIRLVCTLSATPDVFSEEFCKHIYACMRG